MNERRRDGARHAVCWHCGGRSVALARLVFLALLFTSRGAWAVTPQDYEKGRHLNVVGGAALGLYTLPLDVLTAVDGNVAELAVFNADGNVVTYTVRVPEVAERHALTQTLPLFPQYAEVPQHGGTATIEVATQSDGTLARVQVLGQPSQPTSKSRIQRYLVDASAAKGPIEELSFVVRPNAGVDANLTWPIRIAAGSSLDALSRVSYSGTLARLSYQGTSLNVDTLATPKLREPYLAITWDGEAPGVIERIEARVSTQGSAAAHETTRVEAQRIALGAANAAGASRFGLMYDAGAALPLRELRLEWPEENSVALVDVYTNTQPPSGSDVGVLAFSGAVFRLSQHGSAVENAPLSVDTQARYVTVTTSQTASVAALGLNREEGRFPALSLTYAATQVLFVATGAPPFTLAYGSYQPSHAVSPDEFGSLGSSLNVDPSAQDNVVAGEPFRLGTKVQPQAPWPWKRIGLWAVLLLGLGVLVVMTRSLLRRLQ